MPSAGKLYHHKMKMRHLTAESDTQETIEYLKKRHPLYFLTRKLNLKQITNLIDKVKYKLKQKNTTLLSDQTSKVINNKTNKA